MSITTINLGKIRVNWRGAWASSSTYQINDAVSNSGSSYICVSAHTSGTFATDLASAYWQIMAQGQSTNTTTGDIKSTGNDISSISSDLGLTSSGGSNAPSGIYDTLSLFGNLAKIAKYS
jgi:hypothetical protein